MYNLEGKKKKEKESKKKNVHNFIFYVHERRICH